MPAAYSAGISRFELADRGFHLDADKSSGLTNDEVVAAHFSPGLARGQAVLGGARHKNRLRPLAAQFLVLDDFRLARFHPPRTEKAASDRSLSSAALSSDSTGMKIQRQVRQPEK